MACTQWTVKYGFIFIYNYSHRQKFMRNIIVANLIFKY